MNKDRRNQLNGLHCELSALKDRVQELLDEKPEDDSVRDKEAADIVGGIEDIKSQVECLKEEEQEYYDNMHENFRQGDRGQEAETAISEMEDADTSLDSAISDLSDPESYDSAVSFLDDALSSIDNATA